MKSIYFDNSATTRVLDCAAEKACKVMTDAYGNPSSVHGMGIEAAKILSDSRDIISASLGIRQRGSHSVFFTASGTESDNMAINGALYSKNYRFKPRIIVTDSEHPAVMAQVNEAERKGFDTVRLSTKGGVIDLDEFRSAMTPETVLVSVMMVNNETGAIYDVKRIFSEAKETNPDVITHCDAIQAYMKLEINPSKLGCDLMSISAHKIGAPKGVGALICDNSLITKKKISPIIFGGGQEQGLRSGTENLPGIAAFAEAVCYHKIRMSEEYEHVKTLRERLISSLPDGVTVNTPLDEYLPHIISMTAQGVKSEVLVRALSSEGIYVSAGSACSSKKLKTSTVLTSFGLTPDEADSTIRVSLSAFNTSEETGIFCKALGDILSRLTKKR